MRQALRTAALAALLACALLACGKKGPPLPPLPGMKPAVADLEIWQIGTEAHATFSLPVRPSSQEVDYATLSVELWRRPHDEAATDSGREEDLAAFRDSAVRAVALEGEAMIDFLASPRPMLVDPLPPELLDGQPLEYALVLRTNVAKRGTLSNPALLTPHRPPAPPTNIRAELEEAGILLEFDPPPPLEPEPEPEPAPDADTEAEGEEPAPTAEAAAEGEAPAAAPAKKPSIKPQFNVYRAEGDRSFDAAPLNAKPLSTASVIDKDVRAGRRYRYRVRSLVDLDGDRVESIASDEVTVEFRDAFPPRIPEGLRLILEGRRAVNLIWNPNNEPDLGGYAVFRRQAGGEWGRLDAGGARTATFTDSNVAPGQRYEYAVSAFDTARTPNESSKSAPQSIDIPALAGAP